MNMLMFELPQEEIHEMPKTLPSQNPDKLSNSILSETSQTYRMDCCAIKRGGFPTKDSWSVAHTN